MREIDCRGMSCPQPVVTTKQALDQLEEGELIVIVDNPFTRIQTKRDLLFWENRSVVSGASLLKSLSGLWTA